MTAMSSRGMLSHQLLAKTRSSPKRKAEAARSRSSTHQGLENQDMLLDEHASIDDQLSDLGSIQEHHDDSDAEEKQLKQRQP